MKIGFALLGTLIGGLVLVSGINAHIRSTQDDQYELIVERLNKRAADILVKKREINAALDAAYGELDNASVILGRVGEGDAREMETAELQHAEAAARIAELEHQRRSLPSLSRAERMCAGALGPRSQAIEKRVWQACLGL